nr:DUF6252 family protein [Candidatus Krumholzibacteria bacterium]
MRRIAQLSSSTNSMKQLTLAFLLMGVLAVAGCGGDDDNPTNPGGGGGGGGETGTVSATINGESWTGQAVTAVNNSGIIGVGATNLSSGWTVGIGWVGGATGTYSVGDTSPVVCTVQALDGTTWQAADEIGSGTINVTALDADHVAGTFTFTAVRTTGTTDPATISVTS